MKAARKSGRRIELIDTELRPLESGEIRLKVDACGICGTDLTDNPDEPAGPFGHEIAGTVLELGPDVTNVAVGQTVALESSSACGRCANCRNARQELCTDSPTLWMSGSMGMGEEMIAPAVAAVPYDGLSPEVACLSEPLGVAIDMVRLAEIGIDSNVLVMGPGPIGLMGVALARRAGARRVFCSAYGDRRARIAAARKLGADEIIDPRATPIAQYDYGCAIDRILVTTPPPTIAEGIELAAKGAIISFIGLGFGGNADCTFNGNRFHFKKLQLRASFASPALFTPLALRYLGEGVVDGEMLISHRFALEQIGEAMETARDKTRAIKVVVIP